MALVTRFHRFVAVMIILYSFLTGVLGFLMIVSGFLIKVKYYELFHELLEKADKEADAQISNSNISIQNIFPVAFKDITSQTYSIEVVADSIPVVLLAIGCFFVSISIFGYAIGRKSSRCRVLTYTLIVILSTSAFITTFIVVGYLVDLDMNESVEDYKGLSDPSLKGITWNTMMLGLGCCGVKGYQDFHKMEHWPSTDPSKHMFDKDKLLNNLNIKRNTLNLTEELASKSCSIVEASQVFCKFMDPENFLTPMACCKSISDIVLGCHLKGTANETNNWMNVGCYTRVEEYMSEQEYMYVIFFCILVLMILFCMIMVCRNIIGVEKSLQEKDVENSSSIIKFVSVIYSPDDDAEVEIIEIKRVNFENSDIEPKESKSINISQSSKNSLRNTASIGQAAED